MRRSPWLPLVVLAFAQFMVVLDVTIVNVALPRIQTDLDFSADSLQWIVSAYTLMFGGFLLLGGRAADLLGRRAVFIAGLALFSLASLVAGLSVSAAMLVAARTVQGLGAALLSPAALSLLTVAFAHGRERNIALGVWGALAGLGGTLGVVFGGFLVDSVGWEWVFFVNVPIGAVLIATAPRILTESRAEGSSRDFDLPGAILGTAGVLAAVFGVVRAGPMGWGSPEVIGSLVGAVVLLAGFVAVERRAKAPLVPMRLFRSRALRYGSGALALNGAGFLAMFFLTAIFLQEVRGSSALQAGLELLPMGVAAVLSAVIVSGLVTKVGTRPVQIAGSILSVLGLVALTRIGAESSYLTVILPGLIVFGAGIIAVGVPAQISAVAEFTHRDAGAASGLVTAGNQVGGALGLAFISTISNSKVTDELASGHSVSGALVEGFHLGLWVAAAFAAANLLLSFASPSIAPTEEDLAEAAAVA